VFSSDLTEPQGQPAELRELTSAAGDWCAAYDPAGLRPSDVAGVVAEAAQLKRLAEGVLLRSARYLGDTVPGENGRPEQRDKWLAKQTGQTRFDAGRDVETSKQLSELPSTEQAVSRGELSTNQAREVASAATDDPHEEQSLLHIARNASLPELRQKAKQVKGAATDDAKKNERAHRNRDLSSGDDVSSGEGWIHVKGPTAVIARMLAILEPFVRAEFDKARKEGRRERPGAYAFDGLLALFMLAAAGEGGSGVGPSARIIARVDATALQRGHTIAGETCEIDGIGPVPLGALRDLLPDAAIDLLVHDGQDVFNVTNLSRKPTVKQQVVLWWLGGQCSTEGCCNTHGLQIDHRIDWSKTHVTELKALDWLCKVCHDLKTYCGWALVHGRGKRRLVPPDDPDHPNNAQAAA
jgi:hypothetical protein